MRLLTVAVGRSIIHARSVRMLIALNQVAGKLVTRGLLLMVEHRVQIFLKSIFNVRKRWQAFTFIVGCISSAVALPKTRDVLS